MAPLLSPDAALILPAAPGNGPSLTAAPAATMPSFASLIAAIDFIPAHHAAIISATRARGGAGDRGEGVLGTTNSPSTL